MPDVISSEPESTPPVEVERRALWLRAHAANFKLIPAGTIFGRLTVLRYHDTSPGRVARYLCACTCGWRGAVPGVSLRRGHSTACRACGYRNNWTDLTGQTFGSLTAVRWTAGTKTKDGHYDCACICGASTTATSSILCKRKPDLNVCPACRARRAAAT